jgi:hypothetical protein
MATERRCDACGKRTGAYYDILALERTASGTPTIRECVRISDRRYLLCSKCFTQVDAFMRHKNGHDALV